MKKIVMLIALLWPFLLTAQQQPGITFVENASWEDVLKLAQREGKPIFVDAYTTWCVPCKQMEKEIYTRPEVGELFNKAFISVKIQMDSTAHDSQYVKEWHSTANKLKKYILAYPSLLFFSSDGQLIDREVGQQSVSNFMSLANRVIDPVRGMPAQIKAYQQGKLTAQQMLRLSLRAKFNMDDRLANEVAQEVKTKYLHGTSLDTLISLDLLRYLSDFSAMFSFDDDLVKYIYLHSPEVERVTGKKDAAISITNYLVRRDFFNHIRSNSGLVIDQNPDWDKTEKNIADKLDPVTAKRAVLAEKIAFYAGKKDWETQAKYEFEQVEFRGIDTNDDLSLAKVNDMIYTVVFSNQVSKKTLKKAIVYMKRIVAARPNNYHFLDTYAGILYKYGNRKQAIQEAQQVLSLAKMNNESQLKTYEETLNKMKKGSLIWETSENN